MLATIGGTLALLLGLLLLLLPLLVAELSRPRDSAWGGVVLLLGLVLVTNADRLTGAPMLGVLCAGLLIGRLGTELAQARWQALSEEERRQLTSAQRWRRTADQLSRIIAGGLAILQARASGLVDWWVARRQSRSQGKRWVRQEVAAAAPPSTAAALLERAAATAQATAPDGINAGPEERPSAAAAAADGGREDAAASAAEPADRSAAQPQEPGDARPTPAPDGPQPPAAPPSSGGDTGREGPGPIGVEVRQVPDFHAIDALLAQASAPEGEAPMPAAEPDRAPPSPPRGEEDGAACGAGGPGSDPGVVEADPADPVSEGEAG